MKQEFRDYIFKRKEFKNDKEIPTAIFVDDLACYNSINIPNKFSKNLFFEKLAKAVPSATHGYLWHHVPFGGIHPIYGEYILVVKDKYIESYTRTDKAGKSLLTELEKLTK